MKTSRITKTCMTRLSRLANLTNKHPYFLHLKDKFVKDCMKLGFEQTAVQNLANKGIMSLDIEVSLIFNIFHNSSI